MPRGRPRKNALLPSSPPPQHIEHLDNHQRNLPTRPPNREPHREPDIRPPDVIRREQLLEGPVSFPSQVGTSNRIAPDYELDRIIHESRVKEEDDALAEALFMIEELERVAALEQEKEAERTARQDLVTNMLLPLERIRGLDSEAQVVYGILSNITGQWIEVPTVVSMCPKEYARVAAYCSTIRQGRTLLTTLHEMIAVPDAKTI